MHFRKMTPDDWEKVKDIYLQGIATGNATFQKEAPSWEEWDKGHMGFSRIISNDERNNITGWCALSPVSSRCVYAGVAEVSVYVATAYAGMQIGTRLLRQLITESEANGIWTLQAGIFPENKASIRIHEKEGFRLVGYREKIGQMDGIWRDTLLLERRSNDI
ncbi:GNAT family N-acetyltransferase [Taibaiella soli]|uniref:N-acetyltransferase n=1 Tax=Taibaiella soli TaxID=1649169 RepID=A0A2W2A9G3_9BACT|nr:GNAT family N-acetyltransferase [Taibaiella soli]PZF71911.1 N-acetyltransferase [Taibaiella soli]